MEKETSKMGNGQLTIIGTSHIAKESVRRIESYISEHKPDIVAVELDRGRLQTLTDDKPRKPTLDLIPRIGLNGFIFLLFGQWAQSTMGKLVGIKPGSDMLSAVKAAREHKIPLALIDQDIEITLKRFSKGITFKEKLRVIWDIIEGLVLRDKVLKKAGIEQFDLNKVPTEEIVTKLLSQVRHRYPNIYRVLVEERNHYMARNLAVMIKREQGKRILAVVGAGHEEELKRLIEMYSLKMDYVAPRQADA